MIKFGPSGSGDSFKSEGFSSTIQAPPWLSERGVDCFEYSFGKGVMIKEDTATLIGEEFKKYNIEISVHAPYFINLATLEPEKENNNLRYFTQSMRALSWFGGNRCVFHPGSPLKQDRKDAMKVLMRQMENVITIKNESEFKDTLLCAETMGKKAQLGDIEEIIEICNLDRNLIPCIDFGHINSRYGGNLKTYDDYVRLLEKFTEGIGEQKMNITHIHFSKILFSQAGEVKHLTFEDDTYGPEFEPLALAIKNLGLSPYIICESSGTQAEDSMYMKQYFYSLFD